ncbi:MAG TPA: PQQ-dependent sugar dehydrogenase [Candidatus Acidoferrales bacterium]|nr:PQQ-dependent sugar dehydrogenase [Candidatus Acidoferrales bacterium]
MMRFFVLPAHIFLACFGLVAVTVHAQIQRVPNTTLTMPTAPPTFGYTSVNAFGSLTFTNPVCLATPPGETNRIFVLGKNGTIFVITNLANPTRAVFMDIQDRVTSSDSFSGGAGEQGLLGLAFHPGFATNGYFFVFYTGQATNGTTGEHDILSRFKVSAGNTNQGDPSSEVFLIRQYDRDVNHNSGDLHFGADGYLYLTVGDEGLEYDGRNNAQFINSNFFSAMLRLDVDKRPGNLPPNASAEFASTTNYAVPIDNPFIGVTNFNGFTVNSNQVRTEFWAMGFRNAWRWNFDYFTNSFGTNVLYLGDVGQDHFEEVDVIVRGGNYGWAYWEGTNVATGGSTGLPHTPYITNQAVYFPIVNYPHNSTPTGGNCVIGGVVYRGQRLSQLYGMYVYADEVDGNVWSLVASNYTVASTNINSSSGPTAPIINVGTSAHISAFGTDPANGDVLFAELSSGNNGTIQRITYNNVTNGAPLPATLYDTGAFTNLMSLTTPLDPLQAAPGIVPYAINVPFWSDNAIKSRWFSVPNVNLTIGFNPNANWSFPTGTVWIKHFNLQLTNGDPASEIRLETRLLVKNSAGVYGASYRWGGSKTNATLVAATGMDENFTINNGGVLSTQVWHYPSQNECVTCHTPAGGFGLGTRTEQLNCSYDYGSGATNEIQAWSAAGYFSSPVTNDVSTLLALAAATNTAASLEFRSRSFLMANCSQCHQPAGTAQNANWDARITTPTALAGLINGAVVNNLGNPASCVIVPGSLTNSVLLTRISTRGANSIQMPPLASSLVDITATNLISQWILSLTNTFWLGAAPDPQTIVPGNSAVYAITYVATGDFTNDVTLTVGGLPAGAGAAFSPATVNSTATNSTLTLTTTSATLGGTYTLTIAGTDGIQTNTDTVSLTISSNLVAAPGTLVWTNASTDMNWSTSLNWLNVTAGGSGTPGPANDLLFTNTAAVAANITNNLVDANFAVGSLQYANNNTSPNYHVTLIEDGQTLSLTNGLLVGTGTDAGAGGLVNALITGLRGTLSLSGGNLFVAQGSGTDGAHLATLDMSGLGTFNANIARLSLGVPNGGAAPPRAAGVLRLARTNTISISTTGTTNGLLVAWNSNTGASTPGATKPSLLYLGQTNGIYADTVWVGSVKTTGALLAFNPTGLNSPTAYFRGSDGANSRVSVWAIGNASPQSNSNQNTSGTNDFTGGSVDALVNGLTVGVTSTGNSGGGISGSGMGVLSFNAGVFDVNTVTNGWSLGTGTVTNNGVGVINVNGGTFKVNNVLAMAINTGGGFSGQSGTLNIRNGTVLANSIVSGGGSNAITMLNATLAITNRAGTPGFGLRSFAITNSTLHLNLNGLAIGTNLVVSNLVANGTSAIVIDGVANVSGVITFPLISYTGTSPANGSFVKGALPAGFSANLVNNTAQKRIDLVIAPNATVTPRINALTFAGTNLMIGGTNGFPSSAFYVLTSTNLTLPLNQWLPVSTNPFDVNGGFNFTNPMNPGALQLFYLLQLQ